MVQVQENKKVWTVFEKAIELSSGVSAKYEENVLTITGPKGEISKKMRFPRVDIEVKDNSVVLGSKKFTQREKKVIFTYQAHINNMIKGVTIGFEYNLVVVYAKFPITVEVKGSEFIVKNLLGEKVPRVAKIDPKTKVEVKGKDIVVTGIDKEVTGQMAATLEQLTRITHLDRRVIQDGIFITKKPHKRDD